MEGTLATQMEYNTLREEMIKRIDSRQQMVSITLTLAGAFLGIGWGGGPVVMLIYPLIALCLAVGWAQNEIRISQIGQYIRERLEGALPGLGWEAYRQHRQNSAGMWFIRMFSVGGIFLVTQVMALSLSVFQKWQNGILEWALAGVDIFAVVITLALLEVVRRQGPA